MDIVDPPYRYACYSIPEIPAFRHMPASLETARMDWPPSGHAPFGGALGYFDATEHENLTHPVNEPCSHRHGQLAELLANMSRQRNQI